MKLISRMYLYYLNNNIFNFNNVFYLNMYLKDFILLKYV